jgi:hypothetical protein
MEQQGQGNRTRYEALYGVGWGELTSGAAQGAIARPAQAGAQSGAHLARTAARPIPIRQLIAAPTSPAGSKAMARRRRKQAIRVYRHALWRQISGLLIVLAIGIGCFAEGAGLWTACTWVVTAWQWAGL